MNQVKIGSFLKKLRNEKGLTQEKLAEHFHVSSRTVSRWETGNNMPDLAVLVEIADYFRVDIREIINGERKSESMDSEEKETLLLAAEYAEREKELLLKRVRIINIIGAVAMAIGSIMTALEGSPLPIFGYAKGLCFGTGFGAILCSILYTMGVLAWLRQRKHRPTMKLVFLACAILCCVLFVLALAHSM